MIICIPVRMSSTRLPGKAMMNLGDRPLFAQVYENVVRSGYKAVICTSKEQEDRVIAWSCLGNDIPYFTGNIDDPIGRFLSVAGIFGEDRICRVTGDNPFTSVEMIKKMAEHEADYIYTDSPRGTRPEIVRVEPLRALWEAKKAKGEKDLYAMNEYLTYELMRFDKILVPSNIQIDESYTVDTEEDFKKVEKIYNHFGRVPTLEELYALQR